MFRMQALGGLVLVVVVMGMTAIGMAPGASAQARNQSSQAQPSQAQPSQAQSSQAQSSQAQGVLPECEIAVGADGVASVSTPITQGECDALAAIYAAADGPSWTNASGWATASDPCTWYGVTCGGTARGAFGVTEVDLSWNQLSGSLPAQLGDLVHLQTLVLQGNDLSGPIPGSIGALTGLEFLALSDNPLNSEIPVELYQATALQLLVIEDAGLTGPISPSIANLTNLNVLVLNNNELSGSIPVEITTMHGLAVLGLANNNLTGVVPAGLDSIDGLIQLRLDGNNFVEDDGMRLDDAGNDDAGNDDAGNDDAGNDEAGEDEAGAEVVVSVSCLDGNGRIDVALASGAAAPHDYTVTAGHLAPRTRQVAAGDTAVVSVTGRADGPIEVSVERAGIEIYAETATIDCDPDLPTDREIVVVQSCLQRNGRIDVVINNLSGAVADYAVTVGELAPRTRTVGVDEKAQVTVTGRAEGPIDVEVTRSGTIVHSETIIHSETIVVECDNA